VLTLTEQTARRKWDQIRGYGLGPWCASVEPTGPAEALTCAEVIDLEPYLRAAERVARVGAGALVLGCAGMAPLAEQLEAAVAVSVVEPVAVTCQLAGILALSSAG